MGNKIENLVLGESLLESYSQGDLVSWKDRRSLKGDRIYGIVLRTYVDAMFSVESISAPILGELEHGAVGTVPDRTRKAAYAKVVDSNGKIDVQLLSSLRKE